MTLTGNRLLLIGHFHVFEEIGSPLEVYLNLDKCEKLQHLCQSYLNFRIDRLCAKINSKKTLFSAAVGHVTPTLQCPIKIGTYSFNNASADFSSITRFPVNSIKWLAKFKLFQGHARSTKTELICIIVES